MTANNPPKCGPAASAQPLDPHFESWQRSLPFDWRLLPQEIAASKAHAHAIAAAGILTAAELRRDRCRGLDAIARLAITPGHPTHPHIVAEAEDIHHFVELALTEDIGDLALKLHTGRSRNEQIATDLRLFVRDAIDATLAQLGCMGACARSNRHRMPKPP